MKKSIPIPIAAAAIAIVLCLIALGAYIHYRSSSGPTTQYTQGGQPWLADSPKAVMPGAKR
ncbi:MAG TPA: hypothetical protein VFJ58_26560 [Armatimonadota bacterium]|nr:hypothetical protein [Armatimonadota bacterium]